MNSKLQSENRAVEILIVEDSPTQSMLLQNILERHGFGVKAANDGCRALEALEAPGTGLVISDIQMPEMDGYELCRRMKADARLKDIPVILLTSLCAPEDIIHGLECGADNFIVKPYEEEFLVSRVHAILANQAMGKTRLESGGIPVYFAGQRYVINADRRQILTLLLTTYETAVKTNRDLIRTHEELKAAQAQLIEAEKLKSVGMLAAGVAHEVRNPLAILEMSIGFLAGQSPPDETRAILDEMSSAVHSASQIITELMDLTSSREMGMREINLNAVLEKSLVSLQARLELSKISVHKELARDLPPCRADEVRIQQIVHNILMNACDAMEGGGKLEVKTLSRLLGKSEVAYDAGDRSGARMREGESVVVVEITDAGTGIAPEHLAKLYEPFFSTKPTGKHIGLGLTVAKKMVELHGGKIQVRNRESGGAQATLILRCAPCASTS